MMEELLTDREVAKYLKLNKDSGHIAVRKWAKEGKLKAGRAGDLWRFLKSDVDDFIFQGVKRRR
jgi:excisionase family DNA binding protein